MIDAIITRLEAQVPDLAHRVEGAAQFLALKQSGILPQSTPAAYVLPMGLRGGRASAAAGAFLQDYAEQISVIMFVRNNDRTGEAVDRLKLQEANLRSQLLTTNAELARHNALLQQNGAGNNLAAGSLGNLTAQFNDIGVMLAAGQNSLQLALQQGTQITQVIGPMGAAGAVKALGGAFLGLLSPVNLVTIGTIAAGAALFGWLTDAGDEAEDFEDQLTTLGERVESYAEAAKLAQTPTDELAQSFGMAADEAARFYREQEEDERRSALRAAWRALGGLQQDSGCDLPKFDFSDQKAAADLFELSLFGSDRRGRQKLINEVLNDYAALSQAANGSISEQIVAVDSLYQSFKRAAETSGSISETEDARLKSFRDLIIQLGQIQAETGKADAADLSRGYAEYYQSRISGEQVLANARQAELTQQAQIYQLYANTRIESDEEAATLQEILAGLQGEVAMRAAIANFGADSVQVARLRVEAERAALEKLLASSTAAESLKDAIRAAFEAANGLSSLDIVGNISAAAVAAGTLEANLRAAAAAKALLDDTPKAPDQTALGFGLGPIGDPTVGNAELGFGRLNNPRRSVSGVLLPEETKRARAAAAKAGASAAQAERKAVEDLIASLTQQLEISRETDVVQQEMIRNREALSAATAAERAQVEDLIRSRIEEERVTAAAAEKSKYFAESVYGGLEGILFDGENAIDTINDLGKAFERAAFQAAALGTGRLAEMFGTAGSGGFLGQIIGGVSGGGKTGGGGGLFGWLGSLLSRAEGGMIYGPGSGTSDDVLMWGSNGEFVNNAESTRKNRPLLEFLNAGGELPRFSGGGPIGGASQASGGFGFGGGVTLNVINNSSAAISGEVQERKLAGGGRAFEFVLADEVGAALAKPGGGARRTLRQQYGVRAQATQR